MSSVLIIGAGAAGMMAAYSAAVHGHNVTIIDRNEKCGKKLFITGKGRCNLTNSCDYEEFFDKIVSNSKFMYSSFYTLSNTQTMELFSDEFRLNIKTERGGRVFPLSDKSSDVINALAKALKHKGVKILLNTQAEELVIEDNCVKGVKLGDGTEIKSDAVIVATGGMSYRTTGSDGGGYRFAEQAGHSIVKPSPALVPMEAKEDWVKELQGLSLKNVTTTFCQKNKMLYNEFGEMLFTHYGVSGPLILTASSYIGKYIDKGSVMLYIDCKPALSEDELEQRLIRDFGMFINQQFKNALGKLFPSKLIPVIVNLSGISPEKQVNSITREERHKLVKLIKAIPITIVSLRDFNEAIITQGGVKVKEVNPSTLESRLCKNLYFAGEVLDVDAVTGGYNLQVAWSTGYLAGMSIE